MFAEHTKAHEETMQDVDASHNESLHRHMSCKLIWFQFCFCWKAKLYNGSTIGNTYFVAMGRGAISTKKVVTCSRIGPMPIFFTRKVHSI